MENVDISNIKARDGTSSATIADSTGVMTIGSSVLTTTDINGGTIDNVNINTSNITVGTGKTLNVSQGTLTLADDQISGDKVEGGTINSTTISTLSSTTGNITNVNSTTVDSVNLEVTNIKARDGTSSATIADSTGVMTINSSVLTTTDINGGNIDSTIIGSQTPSSATFTNITVNDENAIIFEGSTNSIYETTISIDDPTDDRTITVPNISGTLLTNSHSVTELSDVTNAGSGIIISDSERTKLNNIEVGATGDQTASEIGTLLGEVGGHIIPTSDEQYDLGSSTYKFRTLYLAGDTIKLGNPI